MLEYSSAGRRALFLHAVGQQTWNDGAHEHTLAHGSANRETTNLGTIEAERVTYICDTFALYYTSDQNGGAIRRMVF